MSSAVDELQNFECVNIDLQKHSKCSNAQVAKADVVVKHEKVKCSKEEKTKYTFHAEDKKNFKKKFYSDKGTCT